MQLSPTIILFVGRFYSSVASFLCQDKVYQPPSLCQVPRLLPPTLTDSSLPLLAYSKMVVVVVVCPIVTFNYLTYTPTYMHIKVRHLTISCETGVTADSKVPMATYLHWTLAFSATGRQHISKHYLATTSSSSP